MSDDNKEMIRCQDSEGSYMRHLMWLKIFNFTYVPITASYHHQTGTGRQDLTRRRYRPSVFTLHKVHKFLANTFSIQECRQSLPI